MPRFHGYICSRTEKLFRDKEQYIIHLRKLAKESLHKKRVAREMVPIRESFDIMRLGATGEGDLLAWLDKKRADIVRVACLIDPGQDGEPRTEKLKIVVPGDILFESFGEQVKVDGAVSFLPGQTNFALLAQEVIVASATPKKTAFLEMIVDVMREIPGVVAYNRSKGIVLRLFAEDWPYVAGSALYRYRGMLDTADHVRHSTARILERRYPAVSFDQYLAICETGMLSGNDAMWDEASFLHWLEHSHEHAQGLPELTDMPHIQDRDALCR